MNRSELNLNEYFDFIDPDDIRIKGTRVGIETVIDEYLHACSPEEIAVRYPMLTLEQVYATITYYLHNQFEMDSYLERWKKYGEEAWQQQNQNPSSDIQRLRDLKRRRAENSKRISA